MTKSNKMYIIRCPHCNHRVFDADFADVEIKCPECRKVFEVKLEKKAGLKVNRSGTEPQRERMTHL